MRTFLSHLINTYWQICAFLVSNSTKGGNFITTNSDNLIPRMLMIKYAKNLNWVTTEVYEINTIDHRNIRLAHLTTLCLLIIVGELLISEFLKLCDKFIPCKTFKKNIQIGISPKHACTPCIICDYRLTMLLDKMLNARYPSVE